MCKYCQSYGCDYANVNDIPTNFEIDSISLHMSNGWLYVYYKGLEESDGTRLDINYCPMCGRKLNE